MGPIMATAKAQAVVARWHPVHVLLVGIACGISKKTELGDVLVARQIADYTLGKVHPDGHREIRWDVYRAGANLLDVALNLALDDWRGLITERRPEPGTPMRRCDVMVAGGDVVANADTIETYKGDWAKVIGIEMEGGGVAAGLHNTPERPELLMIKGVSDFGKGKHAVEAWRPYAADAAASFALAVMRSGTGPVARPKWRLAGLAALLLLVAALAVVLGFRWRRAATVRMHNDDGVAALNDGRHDDARNAFAAALAADPRNAAAHASLSVLEEREGNHRKAIEEAQAAVRAAPKDALTHFNLGVLLARQERFEEALPRLQQAADLDTHYERPYNEMGNIYLKLGRPAEARQVLTAGLKRNPQFAALSKNLGRALLAEGHAEDAAQRLRAALPLYRGDRAGRAEATYWLAAADASRKQHAEVCAGLASYRELDPQGLGVVAAEAIELTRSEGCR